jgi:hypothetical protein
LHIRDIKTAIKAGEFKINTGASKQLITFEFDDNFDTTFRGGFVYIFVVDGVIYKIGGSLDKGGVKGTLGFYCNATGGRPGPNRFGCMILLARELFAGKKVETYIIKFPQPQVTFQGMFTEGHCKVFAYKELEKHCLTEFHDREGKYPIWNLQENHMDWEQDIRTAHSQFLSSSDKTCELLSDMQAERVRLIS